MELYHCTDNDPLCVAETSLLNAGSKRRLSSCMPARSALGVAREHLGLREGNKGLDFRVGMDRPRSQREVRP